MASVMRSYRFGEHRHGDIELHYCIEGSVTFTVNKKRVTVKEGELLLISPMSAHALISEGCTEGRSLLVVVGVALLKNFFSPFSKYKEDMLLLSREDLQAQRKLSEVLEETAVLCEEEAEINALLVRGNIYKICAYLIDIISSSDKSGDEKNRELRKINGVEKALEMIYRDYSGPLTVEAVATATGYGKSNFCKIFKEVTGDTFHNVLNRKRVQNACDLLRETNMQISEIAAQVGFEETKSFCRVFKATVGSTPGQYRKSRN